jgi:hypothetical protein
LGFWASRIIVVGITVPKIENGLYFKFQINNKIINKRPLTYKKLSSNYSGDQYSAMLDNIDRGFDRANLIEILVLGQFYS